MANSGTAKEVANARNLPSPTNDLCNDFPA